MSKEYSPTIWTPDSERELHFNIPSINELEQAWSVNHNRPLLTLDSSMYGVAEQPLRPPTAILSVDLCEVVRNTGLSVLKIPGATIEDMVADGQTGYMDYGSTVNGWSEESAQSNRQLYIQELMQHDHVDPAPYTDVIRAFMERWRDQGVYVIANTSTLPGCELNTIRFLDQHFPDCFQGILLPRNHDGQGSVTKSMILSETMHAIATQTEYLTQGPTVAIDDAMHHANDFDRDGVQVFVPAYAWNEGFDDHPRIVRVGQTLGTVDTFVAVDQYFADHLPVENREVLPQAS